MKILNYENMEKDFFEKIEFSSIQSVETIIKDVKANGDEAVRRYTNEFDNENILNFEVSKEEIEAAFKKVDKETIEAIKFSIKNVQKFAKKQLKCIKNLKSHIGGNILGHKIVPVDAVGCYIPGGNYPLLSSAVMTVVPSKIAGVKKVFAFSPKIKPETIVAANLAGANKIYKIGGVQAISAMAYGTESVEKVNKIVGPGNKYVTSAKKYVFGEVGIDFLAGPSEVMIVADESANTEFVAADMLAQCEHDKDARAFLICKDEKFAQNVQEIALKQLKDLETKEITQISFEKSFAIVVKNMQEN